MRGQCLQTAQVWADLASVGMPPSGLGTHRDADLTGSTEGGSQTFQSPGRVGGAKVGSHPTQSYFLEEKDKGQEKRGEQISKRGDRHSRHKPNLAAILRTRFLRECFPSASMWLFMHHLHDVCHFYLWNSLY